MCYALIHVLTARTKPCSRWNRGFLRLRRLSSILQPGWASSGPRFAHGLHVTVGNNKGACWDFSKMCTSGFQYVLNFFALFLLSSCLFWQLYVTATDTGDQPSERSNCDFTYVTFCPLTCTLSTVTIYFLAKLPACNFRDLRP